MNEKATDSEMDHYQNMLDLHFEHLARPFLPDPTTWRKNLSKAIRVQFAEKDAFNNSGKELAFHANPIAGILKSVVCKFNIKRPDDTEAKNGEIPKWICRIVSYGSVPSIPEAFAAMNAPPPEKKSPGRPKKEPELEPLIA